MSVQDHKHGNPPVVEKSPYISTNNWQSWKYHLVEKKRFVFMALLLIMENLKNRRGQVGVQLYRLKDWCEKCCKISCIEFFIFAIYATFLCDSILACLCTYFCLIGFCACPLFCLCCFHLFFFYWHLTCLCVPLNFDPLKKFCVWFAFFMCISYALKLLFGFF